MATDLSAESAIFERVLLRDDCALSPEVARYFLSIKFSEDDKNRMHELAAKARSGSLTESEEAEIDGFEHVGHVLAILQSRARMALREKNSPAA